MLVKFELKSLKLKNVENVLEDALRLCKGFQVVVAI